MDLHTPGYEADTIPRGLTDLTAIHYETVDFAYRSAHRWGEIVKERVDYPIWERLVCPRFHVRVLLLTLSTGEDL